MGEPLAGQVLRKIGEVCSLYHRLILVVGPAGSGKRGSVLLAAIEASRTSQ